MASRTPRGVMAAGVACVMAVACGSSDSGDEVANGGAGKDGGGSGGSLLLDPTAGNDGRGEGGDGRSGPAPGTLPVGFTKADVGGYKLGEPIVDGEGVAGAPSDGDGDGEGCGTTIRAVIRDFTSEHPDFEKEIGAEQGLVEATLGADRKPVFAHEGATKTVSGPESFDQWYRNEDGVNMPFVLEVFFAPKDGTTSFQSTAFFPLDGNGFGNADDSHNFHFTTEIHTQFRYKGKEVFNFTGDDDVWIYINGRLMVDLGGVHAAESAKLDVDAKAKEAGLEIGKIYPFDMFQAERHTSASNFRADTNLEFVDCGTIVPEVPR